MEKIRETIIQHTAFHMTNFTEHFSNKSEIIRHNSYLFLLHSFQLFMNLQSNLNNRLLY